MGEKDADTDKEEITNDDIDVKEDIDYGCSDGEECENVLMMQRKQWMWGLLIEPKVDQ